MIGFHNADMIPLSSSLSFRLSARQLRDILAATRRYGEEVARLQRRDDAPKIDSGASVLPGYILFAAISSYIGERSPIVESFNVPLSEEAARRYGTVVGGALSVPVRIGHGSIALDASFPVTPDEQRHLRRAQSKMETISRSL